MLTDGQRAYLTLMLRRKQDPCWGMKLTPTQEQAAQCRARYVAIRGANRCLGGEQTVFDPVVGAFRRVDSIEGDFHVLAWNGNELVLAEARQPFIKPAGEIRRYRFSDGSSLAAAPEHVVLSADGAWRQLSELRPGSELFRPQSNAAPCPSIPGIDVLHSTGTAPSSLVCYRRSGRSHDELLHGVPEGDQASAPSRADVPGCSAPAVPFRPCGHEGAQGHTRASTRQRPDGDLPSIPDVRRRYGGQCAGSSSQAVECGGSSACGSGPESRLPAIGSPSELQLGRASDWPDVAEYPSDPPLVLIDSIHLRTDYKWDFEVPGFHNYWAGGVINHNSGKTAFSAYNLSRIVRRLPHPKTTSVNGVYVVFAPSRDQLSDPWGKKLLVASEVMGPLFNQPFIPAHEIDGLPKYTYGSGEPTIKQVNLKNGNKIFFCVSGDKNVWKRIEGKGTILGIVFDESAGTQQLLEEAMTRLLDANSNPTVKAEAGGGWLLWGATQTKKSPAFEHFLALCRSGENPDYAAFSLVPGENPAILQEEREKLAAIMSKESYEIRMLGHGSAAGSMALYPQWDDERNLVKVGEDYAPGPTDNLWVWFDPGSHYTGIVIAAINKNAPRTVRVVRCFQNSRTTIEHDVKCVRDWLQGRKLEGWVYDQAARKMEKVGNSVIGRLEEVTRRRGYDIAIHRGFLMGRSRYEDTVPIMRDYLAPRPDDLDYPSRLILNRDPNSGCGLLRWQIINCAFTENAYELKEDNIQKGHDHLSDCCRYGCSRLPVWVDRGLNPRLWGDGTGGVDPDEGVEYDPRVNGDEHTPGQDWAKKRIRRRQERIRANQFNAF